MLLRQGKDAADAAAYKGSDPISVYFGDVKLGLRQRLLAGGHGELGEPVGAACLFGAKVSGGVEAFDLGGDTSFEVSGVEGFDEVYAGASSFEGFPGGRGVEPLRADDADSRDKNSRGQLKPPRWVAQSEVKMQPDIRWISPTEEHFCYDFFGGAYGPASGLGGKTRREFLPRSLVELSSWFFRALPRLLTRRETDSAISFLTAARSRFL